MYINYILQYPSRLLIQVPRYGKKYKSFNGIIPSLELDITEICDGATTCELEILVDSFDY